MSGAEVVWFVIGGGVVAYALTAGADFGGGIWHLSSRGPRREAAQRAVEEAIAPIWEANHVWLIFVIVALFTSFPKAFAVISIALHVPIALALIFLVLRGASFVFHAYDLRKDSRSQVWPLAFGISSFAAPLFLGDALGALSTGDIRWDGRDVTSGFLSGWLTPFAVGTGVLAACLFALLAAVYLTVDGEAAVREDFRRRALAMEALAGVVAALVLALSRTDAPVVFAGILGSRWAWLVQGATAASAVTTIVTLATRRYRIARWSVILQVSLVVVGWGLAMRGMIVVPDVRLDNAGTRSEVTRVLLPALALGGALVAPSLRYLFRVFRKVA